MRPINRWFHPLTGTLIPNEKPIRCSTIQQKKKLVKLGAPRGLGK